MNTERENKRRAVADARVLLEQLMGRAGGCGDSSDSGSAGGAGDSGGTCGTGAPSDQGAPSCTDVVEAPPTDEW